MFCLISNVHQKNSRCLPVLHLLHLLQVRVTLRLLLLGDESLLPADVVLLRFVGAFLDIFFAVLEQPPDVTKK